MLNELEQEILQPLLHNENLLKVLKKVFNQTIEESKPDISDETNEVIGQKYRAYNQGIELLKTGFEELENYKKVAESKNKKNLAR